MRQRARRSVGVLAALGLVIGGSAAMAATAATGATGPNVADNTTPQGWKIKPAGRRANGYPGTTLLDRASGLLYVAGTLSEPSGTTPAETCPTGQQVCGRVTIINTANDTVVGRAPVGMDAYGLALDPVRERLYV